MANPVLAGAGFDTEMEVTSGTRTKVLYVKMTMSGTISKTLALVSILLVTAAFAWTRMPVKGGSTGGIDSLLLLGILGGFGVGLYTTRNPREAHITAPIYAALEGLVLGAISALMNTRYAGLPMQAVALTIATFGLMLVLYQARIIRATERLKAVVIGATAGIAGFYLIALGLAIFGIHIPFLTESGPIGIGFSLFVTGLAAFNLILDFDLIEQGVDKAPAHMEWYAAFGILVTLVWLYLEMLRLLRKLRR
jgi:uncharacterized YccA/Bax inhibitor family protein